MNHNQGNGQDQTPDLQTILATLARFAPPAQSTFNSTPEVADPSNSLSKSTEQSRIPTARRDYAPSANAQAHPVEPVSKPIDPATITSWREAIRCVTKLASQNASFGNSIRKMIQDQRAHEMRWYTDRQNLKQTQANRSVSAAKAQSILANLNVNLTRDDTSLVPAGSVDPEAELAVMDRKIYDAQVKMETAMTLELKGLGVPFFGTVPQLVVSNAVAASDGAMKEDRPAWSQVITKKELLELRRKMVQHLEDLYKD